MGRGDVLSDRIIPVRKSSIPEVRSRKTNTTTTTLLAVTTRLNPHTMSKEIVAEPVQVEVKVKKEKSKKRKTEETEEAEPVSELKSKKDKKVKTEEISEVVSEKKSKKSKSAKDLGDEEVVKTEEKKSKKEKKSKSNPEDEVAGAESEPKPKKETSKKRKLDDAAEGVDFIQLDAAPEDAAPKAKKAKKSKTSTPEEEKDVEMTDTVTPTVKKKNKSGSQKKKEKKAKAALQAEGGVTSVEAVEARVASDAAAKEEAGEGSAKVSKKGARFICFVGNLPYTATQELLQAHFKKIEPVSIRLLTDKETGKSKGTAFLELKDWDRMNTALKLYHHSQFDDGSGKKARKINVELS